MPIELHEQRSRSFHGTKRRIYHLLGRDGYVGRSDLAVCVAAVHAFARAARSPGRTEEWHLGIHGILEEAVAEERIVWRFQNDGFDGTHGFHLSTRRQGDAARIPRRRDALRHRRPSALAALRRSVRALDRSALRQTRAGLRSASDVARRRRFRRRRGPAVRRGAARSRHGARVRARPRPSGRCRVVRGRYAAARTRSRSRAPRAVGDASRRLRLSRRERGRVWAGVPRAGGRRLGRAQLRIGARLARDVRDPSLGRRGAEADVAAANGARRASSAASG